MRSCLLGAAAHRHAAPLAQRGVAVQRAAAGGAARRGPAAAWRPAAAAPRAAAAAAAVPRHAHRLHAVQRRLRGGALHRHQLAAQGGELVVEQVQGGVHLCREVLAVHGSRQLRAAAGSGGSAASSSLLPRAQHRVCGNERVLQQARQLALGQLAVRPVLPEPRSCHCRSLRCCRGFCSRRQRCPILGFDLWLLLGWRLLRCSSGGGWLASSVLSCLSCCSLRLLLLLTCRLLRCLLPRRLPLGLGF